LAPTVPRALLAGGVILNVRKGELPEEQKSRFGAFAPGASGYAAILVAPWRGRSRRRPQGRAGPPGRGGTEIVVLSGRTMATPGTDE
jgi:hypothetical protein